MAEAIDPELVADKKRMVEITDHQFEVNMSYHITSFLV